MNFLLIAITFLLSVARADGGSERYIIGLREGVAAAAAAGPSDRLPHVHMAIATLSEQEVQALSNAGGVTFVQKDRYAKWIDAAELKDTAFGEASPELAGREILPWGIQRVNAMAAWPKTEGDGVKVAVIDTGIDFNHPDLFPNYRGGVNYVSPGLPPGDDHGHGSHVSGTIAAAHNGVGVIGVAPKASLYALKVLNGKGEGWSSDIVRALDWCVANRIQVVNMSLGQPDDDPAMHQAVQYAVRNDVTVVAAAGNSGGDVDYPGSYPELLTVSALTQFDDLAYFSSRGPSVDFIAPGVDVTSVQLAGDVTQMSGTSMATPHVAGLAALAIGAGATTPDQVRAALTQAATPVDFLNEEEQGAGVIDAGTLVKSLARLHGTVLVGGARRPGVQVTAWGKAHGDFHVTTTDAAGIFAFPSLYEDSSYNVVVNGQFGPQGFSSVNPGFSFQVRNDVRLDLGPDGWHGENFSL